MASFTKQCFCKKSKVDFISARGYKPESVDIVWCPLCADRASAQALVIHVIDDPKLLGIWAIKYNAAVLERIDKDFANNADYYANLFKNGRCTFAGLKGRVKHKKYLIHGMRQDISDLKFKEFLSGPDYIMSRKDGRPHSLPKKTRSSSEESYFPSRGYKS